MNSTETGIIKQSLNVYLRIRPFIDDEIERDENEKLIDILDEKHIAVKLYPTINNTIRTIQTSYNEYQVVFEEELDKNTPNKCFRLLEYLIIVVLNKNYSNKFLMNQQMKFLLVRIGFSVHLV